MTMDRDGQALEPMQPEEVATVRSTDGFDFTKRRGPVHSAAARSADVNSQIQEQLVSGSFGRVQVRRVADDRRRPEPVQLQRDTVTNHAEVSPGALSAAETAKDGNAEAKGEVKGEERGV